MTVKTVHMSKQVAILELHRINVALLNLMTNKRENKRQIRLIEKYLKKLLRTSSLTNVELNTLYDIYKHIEAFRYTKPDADI
jgi:hypothetical protein